jgi:hypothetical protein
VFAPAAPKSKKLKGLFVGVSVPFEPKSDVELSFSFSDPEPSSSDRDIRERRLPFDVVVCFWRLVISSSELGASVSDAPNFRLGGVVDSTVFAACSSSESESSWLLDEATDDTWPKMLLDGVCAVLGASNTDPVVDRAGLAGREPNSPGVVAPLAGFERLAKGFEADVEADVAPKAGREKPGAAAAAAFSLAIRSASFLSYLADHSSLVSSSES